MSTSTGEGCGAGTWPSGGRLHPTLGHRDSDPCRGSQLQLPADSTPGGTPMAPWVGLCHPRDKPGLHSPMLGIWSEAKDKSSERGARLRAGTDGLEQRSLPDARHCHWPLLPGSEARGCSSGLAAASSLAPSSYFGPPLSQGITEEVSKAHARFISLAFLTRGLAPSCSVVPAQRVHVWN